MRRLFSLLLVSSAWFQQPAPADAAPVPAAPDHLQPVRGYVGDWTWQWTDEHGQSKTNQSSVQADPSGAFLIDRALDGSEFNLYFWNPQARAITSAGFTTDGDHGWSTLTVRGQSWIEQSFGYDQRAKLRTHVDQWHWAHPDLATYRETHIFRDGMAEPDDFELTCRRAAPGQIQSPATNEAAALSAFVKPVAALLGNWRVHWLDPGGTSRAARTTVEAAADGNILVERTQGTHVEHPDWTDIKVWFWQPEKHSLATFQIYGDGAVASGIVHVQAERWIIQSAGATGEGEAVSSIEQFAWTGRERFVYRQRHRFTNGTAAPDGSEVTFERIQQ